MADVKERHHEVAVLALPSVVAFELGLPHKLIGGAVDEEGTPLYRVRVATLDGGPVRTSAGYSVLPEHDASILRTADTVVIPGIQRGNAVERGGLDDDLGAALEGLEGRLMSICTGAFVLAAAGRLTVGLPRHTGCTRRCSAGSSRRCCWIPTCSTSTTATSSPRRATPRASTCACTSSAATTGRPWPTGWRAATVVAPWREGGQSQFVEAPPDLVGRGHRGDACLGGRPARRPVDLGRSRRARRDERPHVHPALP